MGFQQNIVTLNRYFGAESFALRLKQMQPIKTTIMDLVYPNRPPHGSAVLALDDILETTGVAPVVRRGSRSYPIAQDQGAMQIIDPQPVTLSSFLKANEINDALSMGRAETINAYLDGKVDKLRRTSRRTTEVLAAQTLTGKIAHKMATDGGSLVDYAVDFGNTVTVADTNLAGAPLAAVVMALEEMYKALQAQGYSGDVRFLTGDTVYAKVFELVMAAKAAPAQFTDYGILFAGKYKIQPMGETYLKPGESEPTYVVAPTKVCAIDVAAPHALHYCALDDLDANLQPLPFYVKPVRSEDPSGVKLVSTAKPFPTPVVKAIAWRTLIIGSLGVT